MLCLSTAGEAHLFLNSETQILHEMKAIRHLRCLGRTFTSSLRVKPASISAYHLNRRVLLQPSCHAYHAPVLENVHDLSAFKIDNDRAIAPRFPPTPVIDTDDPSRGCVVGPCNIAFNCLRMVSSLIGIPSRCIKRSPGRPPVLWPSRPTISATLVVLRA
ncbi:hypothetical protein AJ87_10715 [Rhizobium yanglingense]|nr:hypothetical protein AJ87_10715 [Rhizobium yanglingense]